VSWRETQVAKCPQELHVKLDQRLLTTVAGGSSSSVRILKITRFVDKKFLKPNEYRGLANVPAASKITMKEGRGTSPNPPQSGVSKAMNTGNNEFAAGGSYMTFEQVLAELQIARSTLDGWRRKRLFPAFTRLPNGQLRLKRIDFTAWVNKQRKAA